MKYAHVFGNKAVITLQDKLDYDTASAMLEEIKTVVAQGVRHIEFYCGELQHISDSGIHALMFIKQKIDRDAEMNLIMYNVSKYIRNVLLIRGLEGYVDFID